MKKLFYKLTALSVALAMLLGGTPVHAEVRHLTDTTSVPGWSAEISNVDGGIYVDNEEKASGNNSMKLYNNTIKTGDDVFLRVSYPVSVQKGKSYRYGMKVKAKNAEAVSAQMNWGVRGNLLPTGKTADWKDFEFVYNHTEDSSTAYFRIILDTKTEAIWVDDVYFYEVSGDAIIGENLIQNPSFEDTAAGITADTSEAELSNHEVMVVNYNNNISIDGSLADWEGIEPIEITKKTQWVQSETSLTANIRYAYDDENFYFVIDAEDDVHYPIFTDSYWNGDGLQFALSRLDEGFGKEYAYLADPESGKEYVNGSNDLKCKFVRNGTLSRYEIAIPWKDYFTEGRPEALKFCAIINENDNDGKGRRYCLETSAGIASTKDSTLFPVMLLADKDTGFNMWLSGTQSCTVGEEAEYSADLINTSSEAKKFSVKSEEHGISDEVSVPANSTYRYKFRKKYDNMGPAVIKLTVSDGKTSVERSVTTNVYADSATAKRVIEKHKANYNELTKLVNQCIEKNIYIEYEKINYYVIEYTIGIMEEALAKNDLIRIYNQDAALDELYKNTKETLEAYLSGSAEPLVAAKYVTSDISVVGKHFEATVDVNGEKKQQPVFFVGAGHWPPMDYIPTLSKVGFNCVQPEIGPWHFMEKAHSVREWFFRSNNNYESADESDTAEKHSGERSLKITATASHRDDAFWYLYQEIPVKPNTTYEYGLWAKANDARFSWFTVDPTWDMSTRQWINGSYDWTEYKNEFTTGPEQKTLRFAIVNEDVTSGWWLDDAYLREKGKEKNLLVNGGFEDVNDPEAYWEIRPEAIDTLAHNLDLCAEYNLSAQLSAAPHYIPECYKKDFPDIIVQGQGDYSFNLDHPKVLEVLETYYRILLPRIKDKEALDGIVMMNEPAFNSILFPYYLPIFQDYLREKYGDVANLNRRWGTSYADFSEAQMPTGVLPTAQSYDWRAFNDNILPAFNKKMAAIIKEYAPNIMTQTKMMETFAEGLHMRVDSSNDWEKLADAVDINSCDGWAYYGNNIHTIPVQMLFYDYQTSIKEAPIYNSEDHIIPDGEAMIFNDAELQHCLANLWQGAVHGKCGSVIWFWERASGWAHNGGWLHNPNLTERPKDTAAIGRMTLDLNRLANEVTSIIEKKANMGILYTPNSVAYASDMLNAAYKAYLAFGENGQKVQIIVESQPEKMQDMECLVIPHTISVTDATFDEVQKFVENGGKLIVLGEDCFTRNEYGDERDKAAVAGLMAKADVVSIKAAGTVLDAASTTAVKNKISDYIEKGNYSKIKLVDKATGKPIDGCEYLYSEHDGKYVINICTYRNDTVNAELYIDGKPAGKFVDLITMKDYEGSFEISGFTPMLISLDK
jgi:hypothetical protein